MNELLIYSAVFFAGVILGIIFFGGLWLTVKKAVLSKVPVLWFLISFIIRVGITLIGFFYLTTGSWQKLLFCLGGFIISRQFVVFFTRSGKMSNILIKKEVENGA